MSRDLTPIDRERVYALFGQRDQVEAPRTTEAVNRAKSEGQRHRRGDRR